MIRRWLPSVLVLALPAANGCERGDRAWTQTTLVAEDIFQTSESTAAVSLPHGYEWLQLECPGAAEPPAGALLRLPLPTPAKHRLSGHFLMDHEAIAGVSVRMELHEGDASSTVFQTDVNPRHHAPFDLTFTSESRDASLHLSCASLVDRPTPVFVDDLVLERSWRGETRLRSPANGPRGPRNVLLIVVDALAKRHVSLYGYGRKTTPNIDRFAGRSLVFENAFTVGPRTAAVMGAVMTGRLPYYPPGTRPSRDGAHGLTRFHARDETRGLSDSLDTLAEHFRSAGYATGGFITNPYLKREYHFEQGFDTWVELFRKRPHVSIYGSGELVTRRAMRWLDDVAARDKPYFLFLHYMDVHMPYLPPYRFRDVFDFRRVDRLSDVQLNVRWLNESGLDLPGARSHAEGLYDGSILYTDHTIGKLLRFLTETGRLDHTLVVITADHGDEFLDHGRSSHRGNLYEDIVAVPLVVSIPGQPARKIDGIVQTIDLFPTLLDYAGLLERASPEIDGRSFRPLIDGQPWHRTAVAIGLDRHMARTERYKLISFPAEPDENELFDVYADPLEQLNIIHLEPDAQRELADTLDATIAKLAAEVHSGADGPRTHGITQLDEETSRQLEALGYIE